MAADQSTTLLHYIAKHLHSEQHGMMTALSMLNKETNALDEAKAFSLSEKKSELAKLSQNFKLVTSQAEAIPAEDTMHKMLKDFVEANQAKMDETHANYGDMENRLKELATWLAEKPTSGPEDLLGPIAGFVKALDNAQKDNAREEEKEKRAQLQESRLSSMKDINKSGKMKAPQLNDPNMMLEMQLKMAKRAQGDDRGSAAESRASAAADDRKAIAAKQKQLARQSMLKRAGSQAGIAAKLADSAASGALFAQKRAARQSCRQGPGAFAGLKDPNKKPALSALAATAE